MNTTANAPVTVGGEPFREVESFVYLGSVVDQQGGTDRDITARIGNARAAFVMLKNIWASGGISMRTKYTGTAQSEESGGNFRLPFAFDLPARDNQRATK